MTTLRTRVEADVCFRVDTPGHPPVTGSLQGRGSALTLRVSDPAAFAGGADAAGLRRIATELADLGISVQVRDADDVPLVTLGNVRCPWWQRPSPAARTCASPGSAASSRPGAAGCATTPRPSPARDCCRRPPRSPSRRPSCGARSAG